MFKELLISSELYKKITTIVTNIVIIDTKRIYSKIYYLYLYIIFYPKNYFFF